MEMRRNYLVDIEEMEKSIESHRQCVKEWEEDIERWKEIGKQIAAKKTKLDSNDNE